MRLDDDTDALVKGFNVRRIVIFLVVVLISGFSLPSVAQDAVPRFEPGSCAFALPDGQNPACGTLVVPENRQNPSGKTIRIAAAIFRSPNANKAAEPLIYLEGGPGGSVLDLVALQFAQVYAPFLDQHDLILFDQRGVGQSQPALDCQETDAFVKATLDQQLTGDEYVTEYGDALKACGQRFIESGIDLTSYNSAENAADVNDLRQVLGYSKVNLYGVSYGTRLALTVMRDHPEGIRSVIIDSVVPLQASLIDTAQTAQRAFDKLFQGCAGDTGCNTAYPNLEGVFYGLVNQLNSQPLTIQVPDLDSLGGLLDVVIDGDTLVSFLFQAMYVSDLIPILPKSIYEIQQGDTAFLQTLATLQLAQLKYVYDGMYTAVQCREEFAFESSDHIKTVLEQARPELRGFVRRSLIDPSLLGICAAWKEGLPNPNENQAVVSDIPTLVMSGDFDPITPPALGQLAAETLSNSFFFTFPGSGHGVISSNECALSIAQIFLADPFNEPDAACLQDETPPSFESPGNTADNALVNMVTFTNFDFGYSGVVPEGWTEVQSGVYSRGQNAIDQTALAYQVIPNATTRLAASLLGAQFGITDTTGTTREANGLTWQLLVGDFGGVKVDLALSEDNGQVYVIILLSGSAGERAVLYDQVFIPAVDGFQPG